MGSIAVVTTFSPHGYLVYGKSMLESFGKHWPEDVKLYVYYEGEKPPDAIERAEWLPLDQDKDRERFMLRWHDHPFDYRQQPVKFSHKVFAVTRAPRETDWLIWLDGDVETTAPVTHEFLKSILPDGVVAVFLGREWWVHTESGFLAYRLSDDGRKFLDLMRAAYRNGMFMRLRHQHDCAVFDYLRHEWRNRAKFHDLGADYSGPGLDVMAKSALGKVMWHNKGEARKKHAYGDVA